MPFPISKSEQVARLTMINQVVETAQATSRLVPLLAPDEFLSDVAQHRAKLLLLLKFHDDASIDSTTSEDDRARHQRIADEIEVACEQLSKLVEQICPNVTKEQAKQVQNAALAVASVTFEAERPDGSHFKGAREPLRLEHKRVRFTTSEFVVELPWQPIDRSRGTDDAQVVTQIQEFERGIKKETETAGDAGIFPVDHPFNPLYKETYERDVDLVDKISYLHALIDAVYQADVEKNSKPIIKFLENHGSAHKLDLAILGTKGDEVLNLVRHLSGGNALRACELITQGHFGEKPYSANSAFHLAAQRDNPQIKLLEQLFASTATELLNQHFDPRNHQGKTPLDLARDCKNDYSRDMLLLHAQFVVPEMPENMPESKAYRAPPVFQNPRQIDYARKPEDRLKSAAWRGDVIVVRALLQSGYSEPGFVPVSARGVANPEAIPLATALHWAVGSQCPGLTPDAKITVLAALLEYPSMRELMTHVDCNGQTVADLAQARFAQAKSDAWTVAPEQLKSVFAQQRHYSQVLNMLAVARERRLFDPSQHSHYPAVVPPENAFRSNWCQWKCLREQNPDLSQSPANSNGLIETRAALRKTHPDGHPSRR